MYFKSYGYTMVYFAYKNVNNEIDTDQGTYT